MRTHVNVFMTVMCIVASCQANGQNEYKDYFERISRLSYSNNKNYTVSDSRESSFYFIRWNHSDYFVFWPLEEEHIVKVKHSLNGDGPSFDPLPETTINSLEEICEDFRQIWRINYRKIYVYSLTRLDDGDALIHISWRPARRDYCILVSQRGLGALADFLVFKNLGYRLGSSEFKDRKPCINDNMLNHEGYNQLNDSTYYKKGAMSP